MFGPCQHSPLRIARWWHRSLAERGRAEPFKVQVADTVALDGLRIPGERTEDDRPRLPIVMTHGWMEVKEMHLPAARQLAALGHDVLLYDHRAHGRSGGRRCTFGHHEREDLTGLIDHAQKVGWVDERVVTAGHSMGAATVLLHAASDARVAGVIASSPFATLRRAIDSFRRNRLGGLPLRGAIRGVEWAGRQLGVDLDRVSVLEACANLRVPVLVLIGKRDTLLKPADHARPVAEAIPEHLRHVYEAPKARHYNVTQKVWPGLVPTLERFMKQVEGAREGG